MKANQLQPKVVLGVAAHPDDLEFGVAGSIAKWVAAGAIAYYLVCSDGSKGSDDPKLAGQKLVETRRAEQRAAAKVLGVKDVFFLDYEDGAVEATQALKKDISQVIRQVKPEVVLTMDPTFVYSIEFGFINHTDHRAVGMATLDAVYPLARDPLAFPELLTQGLEPHKAKTLLLMNFDKTNYCEDIAATFDQKIKALAEHKSQVPNLKETTEFLRQRALQHGMELGCEMAEGFVRVDLPQ